MSTIEITNHGSIFSYAREKMKRRKQGYAEIKKSVVKVSCRTMTIKVLWLKPKDKNVCQAQQMLKHTFIRTLPNSHPKPRDYSYLMQLHEG